MKNVLLTVSGTIPADVETQIAQGKRPMADYIAMAQAFEADLMDYHQARQSSGWFGKLLEKWGGPNLLLAWRCYQLRRQYATIFTDGEQVGIPYAILQKYFGSLNRPRHLMIVHILSVRKKMLLVDWMHLQWFIDIYFVYATRQKQFIENRWKVPPQNVVWTPFMVDSEFFTPRLADPARLATEIVREIPAGRPIICSVGLEFRDYATFIEAVRGLDVTVVIAAASPWSKRSSTVSPDIPDNVIVHRFSQHELRDLYAACRFVVVPLFPVEFQAGVTTILEAMSMAKAVICTRTPGQTDVVVDCITGVYVPPQDAQALRLAIVDLLNNPDKTTALGLSGRQRIEDEMNLDCYVQRISSYLHENQPAS